MATSQKILVIGDSLPILRVDDNIPYEDTYGYLVKKHIEATNSSIYIIAKSANISETQSRPHNIIYDIKQFEPDIVITSIGTSDCLPRLFTRMERILIGCLPPMLTELIISFFSKKRSFYTKYFPLVYVKLHDYEKNMQEIINEIKKIGAKPIIINIAKPPDETISRSHNIMQNVSSYNKVLFKLAEKNDCQIIDFYSQSKEHPEYFISDGIHLSKSGNQVMAKMIIESLDKITIKNEV